MKSKGLAALRASRQAEQPALTPVAATVAVRDALGASGLSPALWCDRVDDYVRIRLSGAESLELRVAGSSWTLWFAGTFCGAFTDPTSALAEARRRGWLRQAAAP